VPGDSTGAFYGRKLAAGAGSYAFTGADVVLILLGHVDSPLLELLRSPSRIVAARPAERIVLSKPIERLVLTSRRDL
jgi:hypothetical protein